MQSFRGEVSEVINQLSENHPNEFENDFTYGRCKNCGEPSSNELCKACSFLKELGVE